MKYTAIVSIPIEVQVFFKETLDPVWISEDGNLVITRAMLEMQGTPIEVCVENDAPEYDYHDTTNDHWAWKKEWLYNIQEIEEPKENIPSVVDEALPGQEILDRIAAIAKQISTILEILEAKYPSLEEKKPKVPEVYLKEMPVKKRFLAALKDGFSISSIATASGVCWRTANMFQQLLSDAQKQTVAKIDAGLTKLGY